MKDTPEHCITTNGESGWALLYFARTIDCCISSCRAKKWMVSSDMLHRLLVLLASTATLLGGFLAGTAPSGKNTIAFRSLASTRQSLAGYTPSQIEAAY